ncbi:hypothetical protein HPB51_028846 [Rhipicephalus microplus]|uniref:RNA-dependent RNA polymerase n=1 Tax=Rhipicephalus microplus TaxID=6941 RepID=A0A9J6CW78_RHIMP|nr:hypothetical protein HPB51_028846 [Rhipicephalus microplus]
MSFLHSLTCPTPCRGNGLSNLAKACSSAGSYVLGKSCVLRLAFEGPRHWEPLCNLIQRTCSSAQVFYAAVQELHSSRLEGGAQAQRAGLRDHLRSAQRLVRKLPDELALDPDGAREVQRNLTKRAQKYPRALEEALFELYFSISRGKVSGYVLLIRSRHTKKATYYKRGSLCTSKSKTPKHDSKFSVLYRRSAVLPAGFALRGWLQHKYDTQRALLFWLPVGNLQVIKPPLTHGLKIGGRHFVFLGCSTSQLRSHGVWFYARDTEGHTADSIRMGVGDLSAIHSVPKFMARLGQAFSQSLGYLTVPSQFTSIEPDIKKTIATRRSGETLQREYVFSDGIGRISHVLLRKVHRALDFEEGEEPCAMQIRYGGFKGMLLLDPMLAGRRIIFRQSMYKFSSEHEDLCVFKTSKPRVLYLNRPMITILEQSGIRAKVFLTLQNHILDSFIDSMLDPHEATQVLCTYSAMLLPYKELAGVGVDLTVEPFFRALVRAVNRKALCKYKELKTKARILVPPAFGRTMFGVLDETGTLEYGQVFVQYSNDMLQYKVNDPATILEGIV